MYKQKFILYLSTYTVQSWRKLNTELTKSQSSAEIYVTSGRNPAKRWEVISWKAVRRQETNPKYSRDTANEELR